MQKYIARIASVVFHPIIMPPIGMLLLFNSGTYLEFLTFAQKRAIFLIMFIGTTILPLTMIPVMILNRIVSNLKMEERSERVLPLAITVVFYGFTWYMLARLNVPPLVNMYAITAAATVLMCALVNLTWKISLHMTALGAIFGLVLALGLRFDNNLLLYVTLAVMAAGITGWARLTLRAHSPAQVYTGYLGGAVIAFFIMFTF